MPNWNYKKLLLFIPLLAGCTREYTCDPEYQHVETGQSTDMVAHELTININVTVLWPQGEKEATEKCEDVFKGNTSSSVDAEYVGTFHSCTCEKAN